MYCPHFTIVVCAIGVLLGTVGGMSIFEELFWILCGCDYGYWSGHHSQSQEQNHENKPLNVAQIRYDDESICSAIHLKPWIILTAASCLDGRDLKKVYAVVTVYNDKKFTNISVGVKSFHINPEYRTGNPEHNLAVLIIYAHREWKEGQFILPQHDYTADIILRSKLDTYVTHWKSENLFDYTPFREKTSVTKGYESCGLVGTVPENSWFCVYNDKDKHNFTKMDVGSPFLFQKDDKQTCLAIYTGFEFGDSVKGHLFQALYPSIKWLRKQVHFHPEPPR